MNNWGYLFSNDTSNLPATLMFQQLSHDMLEFFTGSRSDDSGRSGTQQEITPAKAGQFLESMFFKRGFVFIQSHVTPIFDTDLLIAFA